MTRMMVAAIAVLAITAITSIHAVKAAELNGEFCTVRYQGVTADYAQAVATIVDSTCKYYKSSLSLNLPESFVVNIATGKYRTNLWTDGDRYIYLDLDDTGDLHPNSGYFHVYGLCQQLGLISLYSGLKTTAGLPDGVGGGWGHYLGSLGVDQLWQSFGAEVWPVPHDYSDTGTARLRSQCTAAERDVATVAACTFLAIGDQYGHVKVCQTMKGALKGEPAGNELMGRFAKVLDSRVADGASAMIPDSVRKSQVIPTGELVMLPTTTRNYTEAWVNDEGWTGYDDDADDGSRSLAGGGHCVKFEIPGGGSLKGVQLKGARYGYPSSESTFRMSVLDGALGLIQQWDWPYMKFSRRGEPLYWVEFSTVGVEVGEEFFVVFDFNPKATDGVYVGFDADAGGHSYTGLPGSRFADFGDGEWMVRVLVD